MIVDCHAHLVPPELLAAIRKDAAKFPNVRQIEEAGSLAFAFAGAKPTRPVTPPSRYGFSALPDAYVGPSNRLMVFASPTCPREENQRALNLIKVLKMEGLPCESTSKVDFLILRHPTPAESAKLDAFMTGAGPLVFIKGKVSNNVIADPIFAATHSK